MTEQEQELAAEMDRAIEGVTKALSTMTAAVHTLRIAIDRSSVCECTHTQEEHHEGKGSCLGCTCCSFVHSAVFLKIAARGAVVMSLTIASMRGHGPS